MRFSIQAGAANVRYSLACERGDCGGPVSRRQGNAGEGMPPRQQPRAGQVDGECGEFVGADLEPDGRIRLAVGHEHGRRARVGILSGGDRRGEA
jgi:hypothetical protein